MNCPYREIYTILGLSKEVWLFILIGWSLPWKGVALWKAARNGQSAWFIAILVINTLALLEIIYLVFFQKKKELDLPLKWPVQEHHIQDPTS